ncbi:MAG: DUF885 domain-containing protein [Woeseiaceae bacterium]|nr:DUF885 domain-containing protein [Woeseiaceae bacterium]
MKRLAALLLLASFATGAHASSDAAFEALGDRFVADLPNFSPVASTSIGDHSRDADLDQVDAAARDSLIALLQSYQDELGAIDRDDLSRANQIDYELLQSDIASRLWTLEKLQEWAWNPLYYVSIAGNSVFSLTARDFAPLEQRLANVASRLEQLPRFLEQARASIQPERVPKINAETAVARNLGLVSIIETMVVPEMDQLPAATRSRLEAAIEVARNTLADHQTWLEEELLPRAAGDFRIGAELYDRKLAFALDSPLSRREIVARAEAAYASVRNQMYAVAKEIYAADHPYTAFPDSPDEAYKQAVIRAALEKAYQELPPRDGIIELAREQMQQATDFVIENNLVTMPDEPVEITVMPEFRRGITAAFLVSPGPLDKGQPTFYEVSPIPEDWSEEKVRSFLREYNVYSIQDLTIHEGVPGHYLQLALSNRYPSVLRGVLQSGPMIEGWAVYAEQLMIDEGYQDNDPLQRLIMLKWNLRAVTNAIIDSAIHVDGMTRDEAMKLMVEGGFQEEREAAMKWLRAQLTSTQLSTYFVGYQEWVELRQAVEDAWGDEFTLRRYHDQVLSYGSPPVKYVRALILNEPIPAGVD